MTVKQSEHFLRTLLEISAEHYGCEVESVIFAPRDAAEKQKPEEAGEPT